MARGLFSRDPPQLDPHMDERMILGAKDDPAVAKLVHAAVADVRHRDAPAAVEGKHRERRGHARRLGVRSEIGVETALGVPHRFLHITPSCGGHAVRQGLAGQRTGHLTPLGSTHTIADDKQCTRAPCRLPNSRIDGVLIIRPPARFGGGKGLSDDYLHKTFRS